MIYQWFRLLSFSMPGRKIATAAIFLFVLSLFPCFVAAQQTPNARQFDHPSVAQTAAALEALSGQSQTVVERLSKFGNLPDGGWKYHAGDVRNGQSVDLDDSSWQTIQTPFSTGTTGAVWIRQWIEIPKTLGGYSLSGARIWLQGWRNSDVVVFMNGRRIAEGEAMEPIVLFDSAKPNDKALIAVKFRDTSGAKTLPAIEFHIEPSPDRPDPKDLYVEFVTAALLVPDLAIDVPEQRAALERAIGEVDLGALEKNNQQEFDSSLRKARQDLNAVKPILQRASSHLTGNSHIDAAWLWPRSETIDVVRRTFGTALQLMDEYPTYTYTQSAAQYNEWIADKYPAMNAEIKKRIEEGRWEIVGGMWVEPDLNMPTGESQIRQLLIGQRTFQKLYGVTAHIGWNPDSFGYNRQLPQIYKKSGIDYFVTQKLAANETNPLPLKLFWWESPDGSKVLAYFPHGYGNRDLSPLRLANDLVKARSLSPGILETMDLYGVGDHGGGPTRAILDEGLHWMETDKVSLKFEFGTAQSYFSSIENKISPDSPTWNYALMGGGDPKLPTPPPGKVSIPIWNDELYFEHHRGTYTTQADHKRSMREAEEWMVNAEKYSSLAWLDGQRYPTSELNDAWKKVLFNQFHDLAAGSGIGVIYKDARHDYDEVRWATNEISSKALNEIQAHVNTQLAGAVPILVFNPLAWNRSGLVEVQVEMPTSSPDGISVLDSAGRVLPSKLLSEDTLTNKYRLMVQVNNVPSLGYEVVHAVPGARPFPTDITARDLTLDNAALRVTVDSRTGCITSLYDKKANYETLAPGACGNQLQVFTDTPKTDDAWNIDPGTLDHVTPLAQADSVQLVEQGPLRGVIRVSRTWQHSKFVQDIELYAGSDQINIVNDIDWHETHVLLKVAFPLAASSKMATYEIPFGTIDRPTTRNNSWEEAKFEVPALRWADLGNRQRGFSLINESKYGYDCKDNVLRLTLLRSPISPDPDADRGHHHFTYALFPHAGDWKTALTIRRGYEYNYKLAALQVEAHSGTLPLEQSFMTVKNDNVVLTTVKKAEDANGLILHFYEWAGKNGNVQFTLPKGATSATLTDLMEKPEGSALHLEDAQRLTVPVQPYSIVSLRIDYSITPN